VTLAQTASLRGDAGLAKEAIQSIQDPPTRDDSATASALILAGIGERNDAAAVARMIQSDRTRESTLTRLARFTAK
jgi:hypothetical protein